MVAVGLVSPIGAWVHKGSAAGGRGGGLDEGGGLLRKTMEKVYRLLEVNFIMTPHVLRSVA